MKKYLLSAASLLVATTIAGWAQAQEKQEVTVWSWFIQSTMKKSIEAFNKAHPDINVTYTYYNYSPEYITALKAAAASGSLPDVIGLQPGSLTQQYREHLEPVNELAAKQWGADWIDKVFPVNQKQMLMGNPEGDTNLYIVPQEFSGSRHLVQSQGFRAARHRGPQNLWRSQVSCEGSHGRRLHPDVPGCGRRLAE